MQIEKMLDFAVNALEDGKAHNITVIDVNGKTSITDYFVIASGTSERHVKALAELVMEKFQNQGIKPLGAEGEQVGEWVLVDFGDLIVHVMLPRTREFYQLEKLWEGDFSVETNTGSQH